ncbi:hypothetical protein ACLB2K_010666 [Fragaria x ananassa]
MSGFADNWRELSADNLWTGLLDPLNSDLRRYIIHYGERAGAIDDVFIDGKLIAAKKPQFVGLPRYGKANLFEEVGLVKGNPYSYDVKNYVYGSPKLPHRTSNLMAYVAVSTDSGSIALGRRDILIAWRGTKLNSELDVDKVTKLRSAPQIVGHENAAAMVHSGWFDYYTHVDSRAPKNKTTSCRDQVLAAVRTLVNEYAEKEDFELSITITGRCTGAAFAIFSGMDIVCNSYNSPTTDTEKACLVTAIVFGAPPCWK